MLILKQRMKSWLKFTSFWRSLRNLEFLQVKIHIICWVHCHFYKRKCLYSTCLKNKKIILCGTYCIKLSYLWKLYIYLFFMCINSPYVLDEALNIESVSLFCQWRNMWFAVKDRFWHILSLWLPFWKKFKNCIDT